MRDENPLHRARLARGIDLAELAGLTRLSPHALQKLDAGRFDELPPGIYARAYVKAFANAVGLDPDETCAALSDRLPPVEDQVLALRGATHPQPAAPPPWAVLLRSWSCGSSAWLPSSPDQGWMRAGARGLDAALLLLTYGILAWVTSWITGVAPRAVLGQPGVAAVWLIIVGSYFLLLAGVGGMTFGAWVLGLKCTPTPARLDLRTILHRALLW